MMNSEPLASVQLSEGIAKLKMLPQEKQLEVLDFIEFLQAKVNQQGKAKSSWQPGISALEAAGDLVGSVEGPEDLSTNAEYMQGFGE
ncbi:DUF2281 domain-containing protein [Chroococcidiopsis sp. CCMEE 29]|uniref:DUF2281 domain-containing protein n=1 Tax=Chroococcidiopsis sp. CCMEE 29 TaxID=155894 RepID=UPI00202089EF|nr:DUF2281 domain-containing protein [Chroococcidiopsis sp. CCMEE 29]